MSDIWVTPFVKMKLEKLDSLVLIGYEISQASMWITTNHIFKVNLFIVEFITSNLNSNRVSLPIYTDFI